MAPATLTRLAPLLLAALGFGTAALPAPARQPEPEETPTELINRTLADDWKARNVVVPRKTTDAEFAHKLYTDLIGRAPTADELAAFAKEKPAGKRERLIEKLLASEAWAAHQAAAWTADLIPRGYDKASTAQFRKWLAGRLAAGASYSEVATAVISASGKAGENGAVHFVLANLGAAVPAEKRADDGRFDMVPVTVLTGHVFLGLGFQCLACHNHPFTAERVQRDFWGVNAFFRQADRVGEPGGAALELRDNPKFNADGVVKFVRRTGFADATGLNFPNGRGPKAGDPRPRRAVLAEYVVRSKTFAPVAVNRTWAALFGRGLLENGSSADLYDGNEPLFPAMLDGLATAFREAGYDQRRLVAWLCNSDVYQLNAPVPQDDTDDISFFRAVKPEPGFVTAAVSCVDKEQK